MARVRSIFQNWAVERIGVEDCFMLWKKTVTCEPSSACSSLGLGLPAVKMREGSEGIEPVTRKEDLILG